MIVNVPMAQNVRLIVVMARGAYSISNRFQIEYIVNPLHNNSNFVGCNCDGGCRKAFDGQSMKPSVDSYKSYMCVELSFPFTYEDAHYFPREAGEAGWVTAVRFTV